MMTLDIVYFTSEFDNMTRKHFARFELNLFSITEFEKKRLLFLVWLFGYEKPTWIVDTHDPC